jgi:flagellar basal body-associated protein FliL
MPDQIQIDIAARRAWITLSILLVAFILGLVIVSFWGGPFESSSYWRQEEPPAYPE